MKYFVTLIAFILMLFSTGISQVKIRVVDSFSRQPLSYATVYQFSGKSLFLCTNGGETELNVLAADTISVSYAGYIDKVMRIDRNSDVEVTLVRDIRILPEVVIKPCSQWSKSISYIPEADSATFGGFNWGNMGDKGRIAMFFPAKGESGKLLSFIISVKIGIRGTRQAAKAPIRFSFYSVDTATMLPLDLLTSKTVLFHPHKLGLQQINVDSLGLIIPGQGFYVALEGYQDEAYSYKVPIKTPDGNVDTVKMYGAALEGIYTKETWLSFYNFKTGQWTFGVGAGRPFDNKRKHGAIRYEMRYAICNEKN